MATIYKYPDGNYEFCDANGDFTTADVKQQLVQYFPELAKATTETSTAKNGDTVITFVKRAGTLGLSEPLSDDDVLKLYQVIDLAQRVGANVELPPEVVQKLLDELTLTRAYEVPSAPH